MGAFVLCSVIHGCFLCYEVCYMGAFVLCSVIHGCFLCYEVSYMGASCVMRCHTWVLLLL